MHAWTDKERQFLIGLEKLTRETGVAVVGCGCCGSPSLENLTDAERHPAAGYGKGGGVASSDVAWISPSNVDWEEVKGNITSKE